MDLFADLSVELTNMAWTNNTQKQQEFNKMNAGNSSDLDNNDTTRNTANIIVDDDEDHDHRSHSAAATASVYGVPSTMTGKRSRCDAADSSQTGSTMSKQVSEPSFRCPVPTLVVSEDEHGHGHAHGHDHAHAHAHGNAPATVNATTFTNLDVVHQDTERKKERDFVSATVDPSFESSSSHSELDLHGHDHDHDHDHEDDHDHEEQECPIKDVDANITAERACHIVDFVLAPYSSSNMKLRTE